MISTSVVTDTLVGVRDLVKHFPVEGSDDVVRAVDGVTFQIFAGETLGLVGESGCGKSTVGRCLLRLIEPTSGHVNFQGRDILALDKKAATDSSRDADHLPGSLRLAEPAHEDRRHRWRAAGDPQRRHEDRTTRARRTTAAACRARSGLHGPIRARVLRRPTPAHRRCPHTRTQSETDRRDEPVSALDVSVQAQVVNLLQELQEEFKLTYLFISHGLAVVEHISTRVAVMYLGTIVEIAPAAELYANPLHPYTQALLSAIPIPDPRQKRNRIILQGDVPTPINPPSGCRFRTRCPIAIEDCAPHRSRAARSVARPHGRMYSRPRMVRSAAGGVKLSRPCGRIKQATF